MHADKIRTRDTEHGPTQVSGLPDPTCMLMASKILLSGKRRGFWICLLGVFIGVALPFVGIAANDIVHVTLARGTTAKAPTGVQFSIPREYLTATGNLEKLTSARGDTYAVLYMKYPTLEPADVREEQSLEHIKANPDWRRSHVRVVLHASPSRDLPEYGLRFADHRKIPPSRRVAGGVTHWGKFIESVPEKRGEFAYLGFDDRLVYMQVTPSICHARRTGSLSGFELDYLFSAAFVQDAPSLDRRLIEFIEKSFRPRSLIAGEVLNLKRGEK